MITIWSSWRSEKLCMVTRFMAKRPKTHNVRHDDDVDDDDDDDALRYFHSNVQLHGYHNDYSYELLTKDGHVTT